MNDEINKTTIHDEVTPDTEEMVDMIEQQRDDVEFEEVNDEGEVDARDTIKKLRAKIKTLEKEKQDYMNGWQRAQADYVNFKKEVESNRKETIAFANKRLVSELLPVLDAYDMARANEVAWNAVDKNWRMGIEYIFSQLVTVLGNAGVLQFGKIGDTFDPIKHESVEIVAGDDSNDSTIATVLQSGYEMSGTVLRPARVKVFHKN